MRAQFTQFALSGAIIMKTHWSNF